MVRERKFPEGNLQVRCLTLLVLIDSNLLSQAAGGGAAGGDRLGQDSSVRHSCDTKAIREPSASLCLRHVTNTRAVCLDSRAVRGDRGAHRAEDSGLGRRIGHGLPSYRSLEKATCDRRHPRQTGRSPSQHKRLPSQEAELFSVR